MNYLENIGSILFSSSIVYVLSYFYTQRKRFKAKGLSKTILFVSLSVKLLCSIIFCYYFSEIYRGGDTLHYHHDAEIIYNEFLTGANNIYEKAFLEQNPRSISDTYQTSSKFSFINGKAESAKNMVKITSFFEFFSLGNFFGTAILISFFAFTGLWKIYELLCSQFKGAKASFALILFIPSILFWTSGILKDSIVLGSVCWVVVSVFSLFQKSYDWFWSGFAIILGLITITLLKPYVIVVLIPSLLIAILAEALKRIKSKFSAILLSPLIVTFLGVLMYISMISIQGSLGNYGDYNQLVDISLETKRGFNETVDIRAAKLGNFNTNHMLGVCSMIGSVLYRPFLWESWSYISLITAIENTALLLFTILVLVGALFYLKAFRILFKKPILLFCILYSFLFATGLGLSVSNFGALVRFKTAFLIFYLIPILILFEEVKLGLRSLDTDKE